MHIVGIEITDKSINIQDFNFTNHQKIVLLLGSERNGIENIKFSRQYNRDTNVWKKFFYECNT